MAAAEELRSPVGLATACRALGVVAELQEVRNFELMTAITKPAWSERLSGSARRHAGESSRLQS